MLAWAVWHVLAGAVRSTADALSVTLPMVLDRLARETAHVLLVVLGFQVVLAAASTSAGSASSSPSNCGCRSKRSSRSTRTPTATRALKAKLKQIRHVQSPATHARRRRQSHRRRDQPDPLRCCPRYERGSKAAPKIVAKGTDDVAARIREAAEKHRIPLVPNPPLARALHTLPLDAEVPAEHFKAVAEIIAYVWKLRGTQPGPSLLTRCSYICSCAARIANIC